MASNRHHLELTVGVFLLFGIACLSFLAIRMGQIGIGGDGTYVIKAEFTSTSGLKEGAFVEVAGVRVGKVEEIGLNEEDYVAEVSMSIEERVRLQEDAIASVRTSGIIGDKFVKITPGGSDILLEPGQSIIETEPSISLEELISKYIFESDS